jgi:hypothetical protein
MAAVQARWDMAGIGHAWRGGWEELMTACGCGWHLAGRGWTRGTTSSISRRCASFTDRRPTVTTSAVVSALFIAIAFHVLLVAPCVPGDHAPSRQGVLLSSSVLGKRRRSHSCAVFQVSASFRPGRVGSQGLAFWQAATLLWAGRAMSKQAWHTKAQQSDRNRVLGGSCKLSLEQSIRLAPEPLRDRKLHNGGNYVPARPLQRRHRL